MAVDLPLQRELKRITDLHGKGWSELPDHHPDIVRLQSVSKSINGKEKRKSINGEEQSKKVHPVRVWTKKEIRYLEDNMGDIPVIKIAMQLERSEGSVRNKIAHLRMKMRKQRS